MVFIFSVDVFSQANNPVGTKLDEQSLAVIGESQVVNDATADGGKVIYRSAASSGGTVWYGPYANFQAGNYLIQFRMKVASNASSNYLCSVDITSFSGGIPSTVLPINANSFRNSNEWQLFTFPVHIDGNVSNIEIRCIDFKPGITDLYLDYVNILPGDNRGFYSAEFTVTGTGNIGVGTTDTKGYKLAVNGPAIFTKAVVKAQANWPDYVFDSSYQLPSLDSVQQYIQQNKHLPEVPSADSVHVAGVDLAANQAVLLQKVEELTLYLLGQDKKAKTQQNAIENLTKQNKLLLEQLTQQAVWMQLLQKQLDALK